MGRLIWFITFLLAWATPSQGADFTPNNECENHRIPGFQLRKPPPGTASIDPPMRTDGWTEGHKKVLFMRANFSDDRSEPIAVAQAAQMMGSVSNYFLEVSYGKTSLSTTFTPVLELQNSSTYYASADFSVVLNDARLAAKNLGYDTADYELDCVYARVGGNWAYIGAKGAKLNTYSWETIAHEFGHNYGLNHANRWNALNDSVIGPGSNIDYGNIFDVMGGSSGQFGVHGKRLLGWISENQVTTVTNNGIFRLFPFDTPSVQSGQTYALKIRKDGERDYWVEKREIPIPYSDPRWTTTGVILNWNPWSQSNAGTHLLDTYPDLLGSIDNASVVLGRTFSDYQDGIHITPVAMSSNSPHWIDVAVNLGFFPENRSPVLNISANATNVATNELVTFTATASDADGDALSYYWEFRDGPYNYVATNGPVVTARWDKRGYHLARCVVTDGKGGEASRNLVIQVGNTNTYSVSGRVMTGGRPVSGARVYIQATLVTYTDSDGYYTLAGLPPKSYEIVALKGRYAATAMFSNPIILTYNATDKDFTLPSPNAASQSLSVGEDQPLNITLGGSTPTGNPIKYIVGSPAHGTISGTPPNIIYQPNPEYGGVDSFVYKVRDDMLDSDWTTVTINVQPVNDPPIATVQKIGALRNKTVPVILSARDAEGSALSYVVTSHPTHGTLSGTAPNLFYQPHTNYIGRDSFEFKVNDGTFDSATAMVSLAIIDPPILSPPVLVDNYVWRVETRVTPDFYYILDVSNDLRNWNRAETFYATTDVLTFIEIANPEIPIRYYRINLALDFE